MNYECLESVIREDLASKTTSNNKDLSRSSDCFPLRVFQRDRCHQTCYLHLQSAVGRQGNGGWVQNQARHTQPDQTAAQRQSEVLPPHCTHTFAPQLTGQCQSVAGIYGNCFLQSSRKENGLTQPGYSAGFFLDRAAAALFVSPKCAVWFPFGLSVWIRGNKKGWEAVCLFQSRPH